MTRLTATELASARARTAWDRGRACMDDAAFERAAFWLGRACRLAPSDDTPKLSWAGALLALGEATEAATLFREVAKRRDVAMAWIGLASALLRAGDAAGAATAAAALLSGHVVDGGALAGLLNAVAFGHEGWCGLDGSGRLIGRAGHNPRGRLDGGVVEIAFGDLAPGSGSALHVSAAGRQLLGSPIRLGAVRRLEGVARVEAGGMSGWAWHPGDPARTPVLTLASGGVTRAFRATDRGVAAPQPFAEVWGFRITEAELADLPEPIAVLGPDGVALAGSPVSPRAMEAAIPTPVSDTPGRRARAPSCPDRPVAIVVPVYRGLPETLACLRDVAATAPDATVLVVDDASPEPALSEALRKMSAAGTITLLRNEINLGFPASVNAGLRAALALDPPHDVALLNSDTRLPPGWLDRLREAVQGSADIGTATPLSNDASIASYPRAEGGNPVPSARDLARLARQAARANPGIVVDVPTGIGFCLYIRRECLTETGLLRDDMFGQGYGEENDFCLRATRLGWRHVVAAGAYVAHVGGRSFGAARAGLLARNLDVLEHSHPGYRDLIDRWVRADPLGPARRRLDLARWVARPRSRSGAVLLVTHDRGGGVERCVQARAATLRQAGHDPVLLRPELDRLGAGSDRQAPPSRIRIDDGDCPSLSFRLKEERAELLAALRATGPVLMEVHHLLGHAPGVIGLAAALGIPHDMRLHDYAAFCPRITLTTDQNRYCGEPDIAGCVACVATLEDPIDPPALRRRSATALATARRVIAPSVDMASRMRRHFPGLSVGVIAHEPDPAPTSPPATDARGECRVLLVGGIGRAKGFDALLACARDAAARSLPLRFVVVGHTIEDEALFETGRVDITGPYREGEAAALIARQAARIGFLPSVWPETWCFALSEMWSAGLSVVAFDIGAQAERIRRAGRGILLPLGAPAATINRHLLSSSPLLQTRLQLRRA